MKLSQDTLADYFTIADSTNSWYTTPTNTFDFVDRSSRLLVVTVGDSWTWGSGVSFGNKDEQFRRNNVFGNLVSTALHADWLNLGLNAQGNFWIASMVQELTNLIPELDYDHIYVVCTFTGVTRWFNTQYDHHIDYKNWFKNTAPNFDQLLVMLNQQCVSRIVDSLSGHGNVTLKIGTNFVDAIGFDSISAEQLLPEPWYKLLGCSDSELVFADVFFERISQAIEFIEPQHHTAFKQWVLELINKSEHRLGLMTDPDKFWKFHPRANGHQIWAEYILKEIKVD